MALTSTNGDAPVTVAPDLAYTVALGSVLQRRFGRYGEAEHIPMVAVAPLSKDTSRTPART
jgi:hypothetical protein